LVEKFNKEKKIFIELIEAQNCKNKNLTTQITEVIALQNEKDSEISSLQKGIQ
jgi:hypothetical protein